MDRDEIRRRLSEPDPVIQVPDGVWKRAAVLAIFLPGENGIEILFTRRTESVIDHKGQVSFPGGVVEPGDASLVSAALRETHEEIGLDPITVTVLGRSKDLFTISGYWITPVVGWYDGLDGYSPNPDEVSRIFSIPVNWLDQSVNWEKRTYGMDESFRENVIFYNLYAGELLWGVTAEIVQDLLRKLKLIK